MRKRKIEIYSLACSPLWRLGRQRDLAQVCKIPLRTLKQMAAKRDDLYWTQDKEIGNKLRHIARPIGIMDRLHERLKDLLNRVQQPNYLFSPRKGRSASMNAAAHADAQNILKLDIRRFYPSTTDEHVFQFFFHRMNMASDVAGLLTKLVTVDGHVPFGSPLTPVLCALVHRDMFENVKAAGDSNGGLLTVWVDDLTISADRIDGHGIVAIKQAIRAKGFRFHKVQRRGRRRGVVITGSYLNRRGTAPANKLHLRMRDDLDSLDAETNPKERLALIRSLIGRTNHALTLYPETRAAWMRLKRRKAWLHEERRRMERILTSNEGVGL